MLNCVEAEGRGLAHPSSAMLCPRDSGMSDKANEVKQTIKKLREERGMSLRQMAQNLGLNPGTYHRIESGDGGLKIDRIFEIAEILDVDPAALLGGQEEKFIRFWTAYQALPAELRERADQHMDLLVLAAQSSEQQKPQ